MSTTDRSAAPNHLPTQIRADADVFALWEQGHAPDDIYAAVAADGAFSLAEVLAAADVVLELKDLLARERDSAAANAGKVAHLESQLGGFDALYRRILDASRRQGQVARH